MPPSTTTQPPPVVNHPVTAPIQQPPEPAKQPALTTNPERRGSTGMVDPSSTAHEMDVDPTRGCSVPIPERSHYPDSFWTAPATGPQSSPPVSPKTMPEHVLPSMLRLGEEPGSAPGPVNGLTSGSGAATSDVGFAGSAYPNNDPNNVSQPTRAEGTPPQTNADNQMQTETAKDTHTVDILPEPAGGTNVGHAGLESLATATVDTANSQQQQGTAEAMPSGPAGFNYTQPCAPAEPKQTLTVPVLDYQRSHSPERVPDAHRQSHTHHPLPHASPVSSLAHIPLHPSAHTSSHGTSSAQADSCGNRAGGGTKGPCRQCMEARMRQQAANQAASMNAAAGLPASGKGPVTNPTSVPSTAIQQPWTHMLGINPYHNMMAGAMYGPMLQQPMMTPNGHFTLPQQHAHIPHGLSSAQQTGGHMLSMSHPPSMPPTQSFIPAQMNPKPAKPPTNHTQATRAQEAQLTTKHIIVDIADTCLNMFPFEDVAKRHNQPEQKVRDIFSAVIQVPLLRCNTDKRRAGKLGTARVKEFNQAKKDAQAQASANQLKQDSVNQGPYPPSAWEMAQFMGPGDVRLGTLSQFSGPW
ncbi:hypothetical protein CkaCkLH20_12948 [Colletotrichum karsti]|uniref:Uncharacterized protein n=1 Tax=Colletotrichum karsti TaxID=1095194 RepID=A0A9P6HTC7_9PEZI|nr:uncharacterized protein CkaCkLH20_12948 [Colletotrichum karsti]KAF9869555.1 hypothetical protein CkaCkLH20_12948 [Colletotrichum karsti]